MKTLTIMLTRNAEQSDDYLELYLNSLREWNADALPDVQLLVLSQKADDKAAWNLCYRTAFPRGFSLDMIPVKYERVHGYPVWDVLHDWRTAWPFVNGRWITANHPEYLWLPGRLQQTVKFLKTETAQLVLGNLRRPGTLDELGDAHVVAGNHEISDNLIRNLRLGRWTEQRHAVESVPTAHWMYWRDVPIPAMNTIWIEDIFFAKKEWLDSWSMTEHGGRLPFQDIYDLVGAAMPLLKSAGFLTRISRVPEGINKVIHLCHPKAWGSWTVEMRDWFLANPLWEGTQFHNRELWDRLISVRQCGMSSDLPMIEFRYEKGGTTDRFRRSLERWLIAEAARTTEDQMVKKERRA